MHSFTIFKGFEIFIEEYRRKNGRDSISNSFIEAMCLQLDEDFFLQTEIRISESKGKIHFGPYYTRDLCYWVENNIGIFKGALAIDVLKVGQDIHWKNTKGNRFISPNEKIDASGIDFKFGEIFVDTAKKQWIELQPPIHLGIELNPLNYTLNLEHFTEHFYLVLTFKPLNTDSIHESERLLNIILRKWNERSFGPELGLVHDYGVHSRGDTFLVYYIDRGSAAKLLLKLVLEMLNRINNLKAVTITSYPVDK